jgi:hypothetical protein
MLSALLRAGRSLIAGLSRLSTADSILMSYPKLSVDGNLWVLYHGRKRWGGVTQTSISISHGILLEERLSFLGQVEGLCLLVYYPSNQAHQFKGNHLTLAGLTPSSSNF